MTIKQQMGKQQELNSSFYGQIPQSPSGVEGMGTSEGVQDQEGDAGREERIWGLVTDHSELCLAPYSKGGTGIEDRKIPGMTELAQPSSHHHTALRNNMGRVWNGPDEVEQCIQVQCQMWHLVLAFLVTDITWKQSNTAHTLSSSLYLSPSPSSPLTLPKNNLASRKRKFRYFPLKF